jgi:hypothetical protein
MSDEIKPTPRGTLSGMLADALAAVDSKLPRMASEIIGVPAMARTMDRVSYGEPLTAGRGMTLKPREDTINALMGAAPFAQGAKAAAPLARKGAAMAVQNALAPTSPGMAQRGAIVYHGSPHTFDKFDMGKIGTGEGAQAYGHGLYFAEEQKVAKAYQEMLTKEAVDKAAKSPQTMAASTLEAPHIAGDRQKAIAQLKMHRFYGNAKQTDEAIAMLEGGGPIARAVPDTGSLFKVDLPDEHIAKMLDWDKPLSQQSPEVQKAIAALKQDEAGKKALGWGNPYYSDGDSFTGARLHDSLRSDLGDISEVSKRLNRAGMPGIKYLDRGSRGAADGTRNYVVFDHDLP